MLLLSGVRLSDARDAVCYSEIVKSFESALDEFLSQALLDRKIRLADIPTLLRLSSYEAYVVAFRVSRARLEWLIEDLKVLMSDIELLQADFCAKMPVDFAMVKWIKDTLIKFLRDSAYFHSFEEEKEFEVFNNERLAPFLRKAQNE